MGISKSTISCALCAGLAFHTVQLHAAEGASSSYFQGTYNDFGAAMLGPSGFYMRNEVLYYEADVSLSALGRPVDGTLTQAVWGDLLKLAYVSDWTLFGGTYNANIAIPVLAGSSVSVQVTGSASRTPPDSDVSGLGDLYITPFALGWNWGSHFLNANLSLIAPTGAYDDPRIINPGRNYWSLDPTVNYTWMSAKHHYEVTVTAGYMVNGRNDEAHYTTGNEAHIDWLLARHVSRRFAFGVTGYAYDQLTHDSGDIPTNMQASDFDASGAAIGPAFLYSTRFGKLPVSIVGKWLADIHGQSRLNGDVVLLALSCKL